MSFDHVNRNIKIQSKNNVMFAANHDILFDS